jgi:hypothetical protein
VDHCFDDPCRFGARLGEEPFICTGAETIARAWRSASSISAALSKRR